MADIITTTDPTATGTTTTGTTGTGSSTGTTTSTPIQDDDELELTHEEEHEEEEDADHGAGHGPQHKQPHNKTRLDETEEDDDLDDAPASSTNASTNLQGESEGDDVIVVGGARTHHMERLLEKNPLLGETLQGTLKFAGLSSLVTDRSTNNPGTDNVIKAHSRGGHDRVFNFHADGDKVEIERGINGTDIHDLASLLKHITISGNDLTIELGNGNSITLVGVDIAGLGAHSVNFV